MRYFKFYCRRIDSIPFWHIYTILKERRKGNKSNYILGFGYTAQQLREIFALGKDKAKESAKNADLDNGLYNRYVKFQAPSKIRLDFF